MSHTKNRSQSQLGLRKDYPVLKPVSFYKPIANLTKVQLNKNATDLNYANSSKQLKSSFSHKRILSGIGSRNSLQSQHSRTTRGTFINSNDLQNSLNKKQSQSQYDQKKSNVNTQIYDAERNKNFTLTAAKTSVKSIGFVKGYAVNSHPGILNIINEDRVCIVTNLNKSTTKGKQISFFGIFDGKNGAKKAQFYRDHYHTCLIKDKEFYSDPERAMKRAFDFIEKNYCESQIGSEDYSAKISFSLVLIVEQKSYLLSFGQSQAIISQDFGKQIIQPMHNGNVNEKIGRRVSQKRLNIIQSKIKFACRQTKNTDFIILGKAREYFKTQTKNKQQTKYGSTSSFKSPQTSISLSDVVQTQS